MEYELWHVGTDKQLGWIDVPQGFEPSWEARVSVPIKGEIEMRGKKFKAVELRPCLFRREDRTMYWALETNLPIRIARKCFEGFRPRLEVATGVEKLIYGQKFVH